MTDKRDTTKIHQDITVTNQVSIVLSTRDLSDLKINTPGIRRILGCAHDDGQIVVRAELAGFADVPVVDDKPDDVFVSSSARPTVEQMVRGGIYLLAFHGTQIAAARKFVSALGRIISARWPDKSDHPIILAWKKEEMKITRLDSANWTVQPDDHGTFSVVGPDLVVPSLTRETAERVCLAMAITSQLRITP